MFSLLIYRFYFVGDEDLLEIIGNSKNVARLQKHFKKMFAGVATITLNEDNSQVTGLLSKEGEEVGSIVSLHMCMYRLDIGKLILRIFSAMEKRKFDLYV